MTDIPDFWPPQWKACKQPDVVAAALKWIDEQYEQAQAAARSNALVNASVRHGEGIRAARERGMFHASATARMVALGEVRALLVAAGSSPDTTPDAKDHEMEGGSIAVSGSNLQSPDTTPEPS